MRNSAVALVFRDDGIVAIDSANGRGKILPGGKCEPNETFRGTAIRELREETGLIVTESKLVYHGPAGLEDWYTFCFLCSAEGEMRASEEGVPLIVQWDDLFRSAYRAYYDVLKEVAGPLREACDHIDRGSIAGRSTSGLWTLDSGVLDIGKPKHRVAMIPLSKIRENPVALRSVNKSGEAYVEFAASVRSRGVLNPIVVREIELNGEVLYGLIDGLMRYAAAMDAGHTEIAASIISMSDADVLECQIISSEHRVETKPIEYSKQLQRILVQNPRLKMHELANKLNKCPRWLKEKLSLLRLVPEAQSGVDQGVICLSNGYILAKLPVEEQGSWIDRARTMPPQEFIPHVLSRAKEIKQKRTKVGSQTK